MTSFDPRLLPWSSNASVCPPDRNAGLASLISRLLRGPSDGARSWRAHSLAEGVMPA